MRLMDKCRANTNIIYDTCDRSIPENRQQQQAEPFLHFSIDWQRPVCMRTKSRRLCPYVGRRLFRHSLSTTSTRDMNMKQRYTQHTNDAACARAMHQNLIWNGFVCGECQIIWYQLFEHFASDCERCYVWCVRCGWCDANTIRLKFSRLSSLIRITYFWWRI